MMSIAKPLYVYDAFLRYASYFRTGEGGKERRLQSESQSATRGLPNATWTQERKGERAGRRKHVKPVLKRGE